MSLFNWITKYTPPIYPRKNPRTALKRCIRLMKCPAVYQASPRRFLDLPTEIRLLIYEAVFTPASVVLQSGELPAMIAVLQNFPELISRGSRDVQLLRTCRICHDEATSIFYGSLNLLVYQHLPLLRLNFLPRIGPLNASFIKVAIITPIGLPGEHQRLLESLGSRHGGLVRLECLTLEIWDADHIPAFISTCQELMLRHTKLKILLGRGVEHDDKPQIGDIPAMLRLAKPGQLPGYRERIIQSICVVEPPEPETQLSESCSRRDRVLSECHRIFSLAVPEPRRTIWSRYKFRRSRRTRLRA